MFVIRCLGAFAKINSHYLSIDNKTVSHYLDILQRTRLIKMLYPHAHGNRVLTKPAKIYLDNTTLLAAANTFLSEKLDIGTQRELVFIQSTTAASIPIFYSDIGDFKIDDIVFEMGGKNKTWKKLKDHNGEKILVKDNILIGLKNKIPLYLFGFLY